MTLISIDTVLAVCLTASVQVLATGEAPTLVWETSFSVTTELEGADDLVVDNAGNAIVMGYLPVERDFFVLKFDPSGELLWSRIIGGQGLDYATGLAVDSAGDIFVAGRSMSADFPTVNAFQSSLNGPSDAILMKLNGESGSSIFATFFGGARSEWGYDLALGHDGSITIVGQTDSIDLPIVNPIQDHLTLIDCFCYDVFVARFSPGGDTLMFSTYLGGTYDDIAHEVTVDLFGNTTIAGRTASDDFPTLHAVQGTNGGGEFDAFVTRIDAGDMLSFSTFLGGDETEIVEGLAVDPTGIVYVTGSTRSSSYPTTPGAFQEAFIGGILACDVPFGQDRNCHDMFVTSLNQDGSLHYSTIIGGHASDEPRNVVVDAVGRATIIGYTYSDDFPLGAAFGHVVTMRLNAEGSGLDYILTHWTPGSNAGSAVALHGSELFIATSVGLPYDAYLAKFRNPTLPADLNGDGRVDAADLGLLLAAWGRDGASDINGDGTTDAADLGMLLAAWGPYA